jgi:hypothetical protein
LRVAAQSKTLVAGAGRRALGYISTASKQYF